VKQAEGVLQETELPDFTVMSLKGMEPAVLSTVVGVSGNSAFSEASATTDESNQVFRLVLFGTTSASATHGGNSGIMPV
jgi:hypothetical protein